MIRKLGLLSGLAAALALGVASPASAGTLDQQQTTSDTEAGLTTSQSSAQTFTAGMTGALDQADLLLFKTGTPSNPVTVELRNVSAGKPGTTALASASIPISAIGTSPAFVAVTFTAPAPVTAGTQYALVAYSAGAVGNGVGWNYRDTGDAYPGGGLFISHESLPPADTWTGFTGYDFAFKTYVAPAPPTPSATSAPKKKCKKKAKKKSASAAKKKCKKKAKRLRV
jgi:hypothetical protein